MKYVRVMDGDISNASGIKFKINEVNVCEDWHPEETDRDKTGGINFSNEESILRWIRRGDTLYDVELPEDAEMIKIPGTFTPNGLFRANKVIVKNPRKIDENLIDELYKKSDLPEDTYYTVLGILAQKKYEKTCFDLINDKINNKTIDRALEVYESYIKEHQDVSENPGLYYKYLNILKYIKENKDNYPKYVKVVDGNKSNAGEFQYKIDEINISNNWNPSGKEPSEMGGFNYSTENKILRWLHRGDTIYDVIIPPDSEIVDCDSINCPHGVFRTNKIIITNPKKITEDMVIDLYKKSSLPEKTYYQCLVVLLYKNYLNAIDYIIKDRINKENIDECIKEFEKMITDKHDGQEHTFDYNELWPEAKKVYDKLKNIKNDN